jgi:sec-independent protein translocase protein TatC
MMPFQLPFTLSDSAALLLSTLLVSLTLALIALIRNRRELVAEVDESEDLSVIFEDPGSIVPHIAALRHRLLNSVGGILVGLLVGLALSEPIIDVLAQPIGGREALLAIGVTEPVRVFFRVALVSGAILASPYVISQIWIFVASGLKKSERRMLYFVFPMATILFLSGVGFAYFVMLPVAVPFLLNVLGFNIMPTPSDYIKFVTSVLLWMGIAFELPLVVFIMARLGLVTAGVLLRNWRFAIVIIAFIAAVVTPTVDPVNMAIVMAPLSVLYLLSIILAVFAGRAHRRSQDATEP